MKNSRICAIVAGVVSVGASAYAAPVQWTSGPGANGHYYERVESRGTNYATDAAAAAASSYLGLPGRLLILETDNYANEYAFVNASVYGTSSSSRSYYIGAFLPTGGTWSWIDGTAIPSSITNTWNIDHNEPGDEAGTFFQPNTTIWDYSALDSLGYADGYIVEYAAVPEPGAMAPLAICAVALLRRKR